MQPYAEDAGENHLPTDGLIWNTKLVHGPCYELADGPDVVDEQTDGCADESADEQCMKMPVAMMRCGPAAGEKNLKVDGDVDQQKHRQIKKSAQGQPKKTTNTKMIHWIRHRITLTEACLQEQSDSCPKFCPQAVCLLFSYFSRPTV